MQFQVTQIEFDFTDDIDDPLTDEYKQSLTDETIEAVSYTHLTLPTTPYV